MTVVRWGDVGRAAISLLGAAVGLWLCSWVLPSFDVGSWREALLTAVLVSPMIVPIVIIAVGAYFFYDVATQRIDGFLFGEGDTFQTDNAGFSKKCHASATKRINRAACRPVFSRGLSACQRWLNHGFMGGPPRTAPSRFPARAAGSPGG